MPRRVDLSCPECGEPALARPPTSWNACWGPRPSYSHHDGQPLCPVMGSDGYQPAHPHGADEPGRQEQLADDDDDADRAAAPFHRVRIEWRDGSREVDLVRGWDRADALAVAWRDWVITPVTRGEFTPVRITYRGPADPPPLAIPPDADRACSRNGCDGALAPDGPVHSLDEATGTATIDLACDTCSARSIHPWELAGVEYRAQFGHDHGDRAGPDAAQLGPSAAAATGAQLEAALAAWQHAGALDELDADQQNGIGDRAARWHQLGYDPNYAIRYALQTAADWQRLHPDAPGGPEEQPGRDAHRRAPRQAGPVADHDPPGRGDPWRPAAAPPWRPPERDNAVSPGAVVERGDDPLGCGWAPTGRIVAALPTRPHGPRQAVAAELRRLADEIDTVADPAGDRFQHGQTAGRRDIYRHLLARAAELDTGETGEAAHPAPADHSGADLGDDTDEDGDDAEQLHEHARSAADKAIGLFAHYRDHHGADDQTARAQVTQLAGDAIDRYLQYRQQPDLHEERARADAAGAVSSEAGAVFTNTGVPENAPRSPNRPVAVTGEVSMAEPAEDDDVGELGRHDRSGRVHPADRDPADRHAEYEEAVLGADHGLGLRDPADAANTDSPVAATGGPGEAAVAVQDRVEPDESDRCARAYDDVVEGYPDEPPASAGDPLGQEPDLDATAAAVARARVALADSRAALDEAQHPVDHTGRVPTQRLTDRADDRADEQGWEL